MKTFKLIIALMCASLATSVNSYANTSASTKQEICEDNVCFPATIEGTKMVARGIARYRYWGFSLYTGVLYSEVSPVLDKDDHIRRDSAELRLRYLREFSAKDFIESGEGFIKRNSAYKTTTMESSLNAINKMYQSVRVGDEYRIRFLPGTGFKLWLNDQLLGTVPGEDFARIYFGIWLSEDYGLGGEFSRKLLGK